MPASVLLTEPATAPTPPPRQNLPSADHTDVEPSDSFAILLSMVQSAPGRQVAALAQTLHHDSPALQAATVDAHQSRLDELSQRADAELQSGRSSRVGTEELGPRGQRLALEKQELAEQPPSRAADTNGARRSGAPQPSKAGGAPAPGASGEPRPVGQGQTSPDQATPEQARVPLTRGQSSDAPGAGRPGAGPAPPAHTDQVNPPASAADGPQRAGNSSPGARSSSIAREVAELLAGRPGSARAARVAGGTEQAGAARATAGPTQTAGLVRDLGGNRKPPAPSAEPQTPNRAADSNRSGFDRLVQSMRLQLGTNRSTVRLRLDPPELGWMRIEVRVEGGRVQLLVQTEKTAAGELMRTRIAELQTALEQHGLRIDRFELTTAAAQEQHHLDRDPANDAQDDAGQSPAEPNPDDQPSGDPGSTPETHDDASPAALDSEAAPPSGNAAMELRLDVRV